MLLLFSPSSTFTPSLSLLIYPPHLSFPFLSSHFLSSGSHAASMQADAPSQLDHARAVLDVYLTQVKDMSLRAVNQLDDPQYAEFK